ncbi:MAG: subtilase family serine protease [Elusimicrobia bacterium]|nr:MAG: subtilase family serine protease [Elusimicrobiota bacterium]KAF0152145.1 MAG: subtilase family serine protease [Elusimicrobiota bacterium]
MKHLKIMLALVLALSFTASAFAGGNKIVTFDKHMKSSEKLVQINSIGGTVERELKLIDAVAAVFPDDVKDFKIWSLKGVTNVEDDLYLPWLNEASLQANPLPTMESVLASAGELETPSADAAFFSPKQEDAELPWGIRRVNAAGAWPYITGAGVKVAVIDTGIDYKHPDLAPNYKGGWNAVTMTNDPMDDQGHGTHVAGTVGAVRDGVGVAGVAPNAELYGVKVLDKNGSGQYSWIVAGIEWAVNNRMQVVNMSLGGRSGTAALAEVMKVAHKAGIAVVCAAGNDSGAVNFPARYPEAIAVSASASNDTIASFSSRGPEIAVIAPGVSVYSTKRGGGYTSMSGTSMASPHAAGLAALAVQAGNNGAEAVRAALKGAATPLPAVQPGHQGAGMVDAARLAK